MLRTNNCTTSVLILLLALSAMFLLATPVRADFSPAEIALMQQAGVTPPVVSPAMKLHSQIGYILAFVHYFCTAAVLLILLQTGFVTALSTKVRSITRNEFLQLFLFLAVFRFVSRLLSLPFSIYLGYFFPHSFGLSQQSLLSWFGDWAKIYAIEVVVLTIGFAAVISVVRRFRRAWVFVLWAVLSILIGLAVFIEPIVIEPMFNQLTVMKPGPMRTAIEEVAAKAGIPDAPIFVVDKSKQTKTVNAYVTGLGASNRIVIWDNTLERLPADQVVAVVAHETGHYVLGHIFTGFMIASGGVLLALLLLRTIEIPVVKRLPARWKIEAMTDLNAIPVVLLGVVAVSFVSAPIDNAISRYMEHQADEFGLQITHNGPAMARTFVSLAEQNLSDPDPPTLVRMWLFSHPTLKERINFCLKGHESRVGNQ